jgi:hypothetical protein
MASQVEEVVVSSFFSMSPDSAVDFARDTQSKGVDRGRIWDV